MIRNLKQFNIIITIFASDNLQDNYSELSAKSPDLIGDYTYSVIGLSIESVSY